MSKELFCCGMIGLPVLGAGLTVTMLLMLCGAYQPEFFPSSGVAYRVAIVALAAGAIACFSPFIF